MEWFKDLFSESSDVSMTRFLSFISVISAVLVAFVSIYKNADLSDATLLCSAFLAAGFTGKVMQRSIESQEQLEEKKEPVQRGSKSEERPTWKK